MMLDGVDRNVVKLQRVWNRVERATSHLHPVWQIVVHPVGDVLDPLFGQNVGGVEGLAQARTHPATRRPACRVLDGLDCFPNYMTFVFLEAKRPLDETVPHDFPAALEALFHDGRIALADGTVEA